MDTDILILAAGASRRFGGCKLLAEWKGVPLISSALQAAQTASVSAESSIASINVVLGEHATVLQPVIQAQYPGVQLYFCADWAKGLGHSLAFGVAQLPAENAILIMLADQPMINVFDIQYLIARAKEHPSNIICAEFTGTVGVPALFPPGEKAKLLQLRGDRGAKAILKEAGERVLPVPMPHAAMDIDTPDDLARDWKNFLD